MSAMNDVELLSLEDVGHVLLVLTLGLRKCGLFLVFMDCGLGAKMITLVYPFVTSF
jgi:hypothetical protein